MKGVHRELLLSFWKLHILHHARAAAINGQWILAQLRRHGCEISPGTLYPLLPPLEETAYLMRKGFTGLPVRSIRRPCGQILVLPPKKQ